MKLIDLLNKIANGEEVPKKILIRGYEYHLAKDYRNSYFGDRNNINFAYEDENENYWLDMSGVNEEIEIIEEDKEIELLDVYTNAYITNEMSSFYEHNFETTVKHNFEAINTKINKLIIAVNELREGK